MSTAAELSLHRFSCERSYCLNSLQISSKFDMVVYLGMIYTCIIFGDPATSVLSFIGSKVKFLEIVYGRSIGLISLRISLKLRTWRCIWLYSTDI